jgi:hypothetical protein
MEHKKLMEKLEKKGKKLNPLEKKAKLDVVKELSSQAGEMLGDKLKGLKKVTVASDSKEGLKAGLEKAESILEKHDEASPVQKMEEEMGADLDHDGEEGESEEHKEEVLGEEMSPEEIEAKIQELMALKKKKEEQKA